MPKILVTGAAGFIGYHTTRQLLDRGCEVVGVDNLSPYYRVELKRARLAELSHSAAFTFVELDLADRQGVDALLQRETFSQVIHLAAQPGVRYSLENPSAYIDSNLVGFANLLEGARQQSWEHFVYASSSSVYGANKEVPFSIDHAVDHPINLYAATKKANELMAHAYSHLFALPMTGLRLFTVYGPWGRPDMAVWKFTEAIAAGRPIDVYNRGQMQRDFTYVEDIVRGIQTVLDSPPKGSEGEPPCRVYNLGNNRPEPLERLIQAIESALGQTAERNLLPMQPGDMLRTYADIDPIRNDHGFEPTTSLEEGVEQFVAWWKGYQA